MNRPEQNNAPLTWRVGEKDLRRRDIPLLMGILNVTPDSFSDGGQHQSVSDAVRHAEKMLQDGADIIDIGGESTRPGADPVPLKTELQRTIPVIRAIAAEFPQAVLSIDTTKAEVARQALDAGVQIVNDISAMTFDPDMVEVCVQHDAAVCVMHIQGTPQTMQHAPHYEDVVRDVTAFLRQQIQRLTDGGLSPDRICIDPGIGFGKTAAHNLTLMKSVQTLRNLLQRPVLVGHSRKRFLSTILGRPVEERLAGTLGVAVALADNGADVLRIHDVQATRDALIARNAVSAQPAE